MLLVYLKSTHNFIMEKFITEYIEPLLLEGPVPESQKEGKLSMLQG